LATLEALNVPKTLLNSVALSMGPVQFDRKADRSVLRSLRTADLDLSWSIHDTHVLDCDLLAVALKLNNRPTSVRGKWFHPAQVMLDMLGGLNK
jgi:hypothetical protein